MSASPVPSPAPPPSEAELWRQIAAYVETVARKAFGQGFAAAEMHAGHRPDYGARRQETDLYIGQSFEPHIVKEFHPALPAFLAARQDADTMADQVARLKLELDEAKAPKPAKNFDGGGRLRYPKIYPDGDTGTR